MDGGEKSKDKNPETNSNKRIIQYFDDLRKNKEFISEVEKIRALPFGQRKAHAQALAKKHGLLYCFGTPLFQLINLGDISPRSLNSLGMCRINGDYFEHSKEGTPTYKTYDIEPEDFYHTHPVSIGISPKASRADVLDFVNKQWPWIRLNLDMFGEEPVIIRLRAKKERDDFIWNNRKMKRKKLAELVNEEFPGEDLGYEDINAILYHEKKRRSKI